MLFSIQVYWATKFILPTATTDRIEKILRDFLWSGTTLVRGDVKVAWRDVCKPFSEGGLGIKRLGEWNRLATVKHVWTLLTNNNSIWATWVTSNLLKGKSFWSVHIPANCSWSWRKILEAREMIRGFMVSSVGNGLNTSLWFDY